VWRKTAEAKPSLQASASPVPTPSLSQVSQQLSPRVAPPVQPVPVPANASKITSGLKISGELSGAADLYIDGEVQGKILLAKGYVTVGPNGRVQADIEAREVSVEGTLRGNLKASDCVRLGSASRLQGNVQSPRVAIDEGARLRGKVDMTRGNASRSDMVPERMAESGVFQQVSARAKDE
jgi:cytoskeletal protein CcmA (bactofilin family)